MMCLGAELHASNVMVALGATECGGPGAWDGSLSNVCLFLRERSCLFLRERSMLTSKRFDFYSFYVQFYFLILPWRFWPFKQLLNETFLLESQVYTLRCRSVPLLQEDFQIHFRINLLVKQNVLISEGYLGTDPPPPFLQLLLCYRSADARKSDYPNATSKGVPCLSASLWADVCVCWGKIWSEHPQLLKWFLGAADIQV